MADSFFYKYSDYFWNSGIFITQNTTVYVVVAFGLVKMKIRQKPPNHRTSGISRAVNDWRCPRAAIITLFWISSLARHCTSQYVHLSMAFVLVARGSYPTVVKRVPPLLTECSMFLPQNYR